MLTLIMNDGHEITWHVGQPKPVIFQPKDPARPRRKVVEMSVTGDEVEALFHVAPGSTHGMRPVSVEGMGAGTLFELWAPVDLPTKP